ncbi:flavin reductase family protein [Sulfitobacter sp. D35]|uniref:flavin reductase family protein n=1 Tax=Sulfitobacter sp. D35 TaxID=3083252 RepID=UPI00297009F5|nr:flavin reductase family protein [Sulfitobacter sp. D35]MDW4496428.1 flavin reductase family protein [Sulfitobacter sp. D35]
MAEDDLEFVPGPDRAADLRRALGCFGTGVTVVTARTDRGPLGMTANSFSSVSLDPPLVMWSPARASRRHDAFAAAERFAIHVLGADQLDLARHFATHGHGFDAFDWIEGEDGMPRLEGCLARFDCTRYAVHPAGDHSLILGTVDSVALPARGGPGLLFDQGRYGRFSPGG